MKNRLYFTFLFVIVVILNDHHHMARGVKIANLWRSSDRKQAVEYAITYSTNVKIVYSSQDPCSVDGGAAIAQAIIASQPDVVVGGCSTTVLGMHSALAAAKIPIVSYSATSTSLNSSIVPYMLRVNPDDNTNVNGVSQATASVINSFGWQWIAVLYTDDAYGNSVVDSVSQQLIQTSNYAAKVGVRIPVSTSSAMTTSDLDAVITTIRNAHAKIILFAFSSPEMICPFLARFSTLRMMNGYAFVVSESLPVLSCISTSLGEGLIGNMYRFPISFRLLELANILGVNIEMVGYSAYAVDAVSAVARAETQALSVGATFAGDVALDFLRNTSFIGITDVVTMEADKSGFVSFNIGNIIKKLVRVVGTVSTQSKVDFSQGVFWPGSQLSTPKSKLFQLAGVFTTLASSLSYQTVVLAVETGNANNLLGDNNIVFQLLPIVCPTPTSGLKNLLQQQLGSVPIVGILATACMSDQQVTMYNFAVGKSVPLLASTGGSLDSMLSSNYPLFLRGKLAAVVDEWEMSIIARRYGWNRLTLIVVDDATSPGQNNMFSKAIANCVTAKGGFVTNTITCLSNDETCMNNALLNSSSTSNVTVLLGGTGVQSTLMVGTTNKVWLQRRDKMQLIVMSQLTGVTSLTTDQRLAFDNVTKGALFLAPLELDTDQLQLFKDNYALRWGSTRVSEIIDQNVVAYDCANMYFAAIRSMLQDGGSPYSNLIDYLRKVQLKGFSGSIQFPVKGSSPVDNSVMLRALYELKTWYPSSGGWKVVGQYRIDGNVTASFPWASTPVLPSAVSTWKPVPSCPGGRRWKVTSVGSSSASTPLEWVGECERCPEGTYSPGGSALACTLCPAEMFCPMATPGPIDTALVTSVTQEAPSPLPQIATEADVSALRWATGVLTSFVCACIIVFFVFAMIFFDDILRKEVLIGFEKADIFSYAHFVNFQQALRRTKTPVGGLLTVLVIVLMGATICYLISYAWMFSFELRRDLETGVLNFNSTETDDITFTLTAIGINNPEVCVPNADIKRTGTIERAQIVSITLTQEAGWSCEMVMKMGALDREKLLPQSFNMSFQLLKTAAIGIRWNVSTSLGTGADGGWGTVKTIRIAGRGWGRGQDTVHSTGVIPASEPGEAGVGGSPREWYSEDEGLVELLVQPTRYTRRDQTSSYAYIPRIILHEPSPTSFFDLPELQIQDALQGVGVNCGVIFRFQLTTPVNTDDFSEVASASISQIASEILSICLSVLGAAASLLRMTEAVVFKLSDFLSNRGLKRSRVLFIFGIQEEWEDSDEVFEQTLQESPHKFGVKCVDDDKNGHRHDYGGKSWWSSSSGSLFNRSSSRMHMIVTDDPGWKVRLDEEDKVEVEGGKKEEDFAKHLHQSSARHHSGIRAPAEALKGIVETYSLEDEEEEEEEDYDDRKLPKQHGDGEIEESSGSSTRSDHRANNNNNNSSSRRNRVQDDPGQWKEENARKMGWC